MLGQGYDRIEQDIAVLDIFLLPLTRIVGDRKRLVSAQMRVGKAVKPGAFRKILQDAPCGTFIKRQ